MLKGRKQDVGAFKRLHDAECIAKNAVDEHIDSYLGGDNGGRLRSEISERERREIARLRQLTDEEFGAECREFYSSHAEVKEHQKELERLWKKTGDV